MPAAKTVGPAHCGENERDLYRRHRWRVEGVHGEAKTWHGLARAIRRGKENMRIQAFLIAAAINLKRLAATLSAILLLSAIHFDYRTCHQEIALA
jgi:hypothetical protein